MRKVKRPAVARSQPRTPLAWAASTLTRNWVNQFRLSLCARTRESLSQLVILYVFLILKVIKNWRWERSRNETRSCCVHCNWGSSNTTGTSHNVLYCTYTLSHTLLVAKLAGTFVVKSTCTDLSFDSNMLSSHPSSRQWLTSMSHCIATRRQFINF